MKRAHKRCSVKMSTSHNDTVLVCSILSVRPICAQDDGLRTARGGISLEPLLRTFITEFSCLLIIRYGSAHTSCVSSDHTRAMNTYSCGSGVVPIPTSRKYPTAYIALASPASAAFFAHRYASVSDCGSTPGEPTRYHAVRAKHASR